MVSGETFKNAAASSTVNTLSLTVRFLMLPKGIFCASALSSQIHKHGPVLKPVPIVPAHCVDQRPLLQCASRAIASGLQRSIRERDNEKTVAGCRSLFGVFGRGDALRTPGI